METHWCILSTVATDAKVLKDQTISIHSADHCTEPVSYKKYHIYGEQLSKM